LRNVGALPSVTMARSDLFIVPFIRHAAAQIAAGLWQR
jgi:hypothetical protein